MNAELNQTVLQATEEVFESLLGWNVQCGVPVEKTINSLSCETSVVISFVGGISGAVMLKCSNRLAARMASEMLGVEVPEGSEDMQDAVGELMNMIVGAAKTAYARTSDNGSLKISLPTTIVGDRYVLHINAEGTERVTLIEVSCPEEKLSLEVYLTG